MLTKRYLNSVKNLTSIMNKIVEGTAPEKFTNEHLKKIGFASSNDRGVVGLLKDLHFLTDEGIPTQGYHDYRNSSKSRKVLGDALKEAYQEIFHINQKPSKADKAAISGVFKTTHNVSNQVAGFMANTFLTLLDIADVSHGSETKKEKKTLPTSAVEQAPESKKESSPHEAPRSIIPNLRYNIEIHLPATKDVEVYNAIFKSLKGHLLDD